MGKFDGAIEILAAKVNMSKIDEKQKEYIIEAIKVLKENDVEDHTVVFYYEGRVLSKQSDPCGILRNNIKHGYPAIIDKSVYVVHGIENIDENTTEYYLGL